MQSQIDTMKALLDASNSNKIKTAERINSLTNAGTKQKEQINSLKTVLDQSKIETSKQINSLKFVLDQKVPKLL